MAKLKEYDFFTLFDSFSDDSKLGRRIKQDGAKLSQGTVDFYILVRKELQTFSEKEKLSLRIRNVKRFTNRQMNAEMRYWKRFYKRYSDYMYSTGCFDNYVGYHFKVIRTFFNYLKSEKGIYDRANVIGQFIAQRASVISGQPVSTFTNRMTIIGAGISPGASTSDSSEVKASQRKFTFKLTY